MVHFYNDKSHGFQQSVDEIVKGSVLTIYTSFHKGVGSHYLHFFFIIASYFVPKNTPLTKIP